MPSKTPRPSKSAKAPNQNVPGQALTNAQLLEDLAWCCEEVAWRLHNYKEAAEDTSQDAIDEGLLLAVKADTITASTGLVWSRMALEKLATRVGREAEDEGA
jgi:hypothetical protein